jgi:zinc protease
MRMVYLITMLLFCVGIGIFMAQEEQGIFPYDYKKVTLENGFTAYLIDAGAPGRVIYVTMVRTGSRDEYEPGRSGYAHFFEHMMFRGTEKYPQFDKIVSGMGGDSNAFTSNDMTVYYIQANTEYLEQLFDLESDRFMNLKYSEDAFKTESGAVLGEYKQSKYSPFRYLNEKLRETAFDQHTYSHTTIGFEEDIVNMPKGYEYSISFHNRYYRPENCILVLVGDYDREKAEEYLKKYYSNWETGYVKPNIPTEPEQQEERTRDIEFPSRTLPILSVNYKAPAWDPEDRIAVATEVLGELAFGSNSEIYRKLVLQEQKLQFLAGDFGLARDPYLLSITAMLLSKDDLDMVKSEIDAQVEKFKTTLVDEEKLNATKSNMKYGFLMGLETAQSVAFSLIQPIINTGKLESINTYYATLAQVTPEDIQTAAETYLVNNKRTVVTMVQAEGR